MESVSVFLRTALALQHDMNIRNKSGFAKESLI